MKKVNATKEYKGKVLLMFAIKYSSPRLLYLMRVDSSELSLKEKSKGLKQIETLLLVTKLCTQSIFLTNFEA